MTVPTVTVKDYALERTYDTPAILLDVREPFEIEIASIEGSIHIPLGQLGDRLGELSSDQAYVVICHHGGRSERATRYLLAQGLMDVRNLEGGIDAWSVHVDPEIPRY